MSINNRATRKDELENAVSTAVRQTIKTACESNNIIKSDQEMMASFVKNLALNINSDGDVTVDFYGVDYREGLLSVRVIENYKYITGKEANISVRRTAIYE